MKYRRLNKNRVLKYTFSAEVYFLLLISIIFILFPYVWMVSTSFKTEPEIMANEFTWIPKRPTLKNYLWMLGIQAEGVSSTGQSVGLLRFLYNTTIQSVITVFPVAIIGALGGYAISRFRFRGRKAMAMLILSTTFFPMALYLIPWYRLMSGLKLIDTTFGLVLSFTSGCLPYCLWLMKGYIDSIPSAIEECAMVDGCNRIQAFISVTVPLLRPAFVSVMAYTVVSCWNNFLVPSVLCNSMKTKPIAVGLTEMLSFFGKTNWGGLMAGSVVTALPVALIFIVMQRQLISGMTAGSVKA
jgi:ABC-type glycerol-3-phosphate transport system permease component